MVLAINQEAVSYAVPFQTSRHGKHKNPHYHREYYQKNRAKFLARSQIYYGVKKLLEPYLKRKEEKSPKIGVKKNFSRKQARGIYNSLSLNSRYYIC